MTMTIGRKPFQSGQKKRFNLKDASIYDVIVIGAGISGLATAHKAKNAGKSVLILEKESMTGGVIQTMHNDFGNFEMGPNSFALTKETLSLVKELDLEKDLIYANEAAKKRYIFLNDKPTLINPKKLLFSSEILNFKSKTKLLTERFKKPQIIEKETLASAVRRRFNDDILQTLVNPIISGIYAGDPEKLEYKSSMKKLFQFEKDYGSFTKGFLKTKKKGESRKVVTFKNGLQQLTIVLSEQLKDSFDFQEIIKIENSGNLVKVSSTSQAFTGKKLVICTPAYVTGELIQNMDSSLGNNIAQIEYPSLLSVQLVFDKNQVKSHLDAFGLLIPKQTGKITLGIINHSSVFDANQSFHKYNLFVGVKEEITEDYISELVSTAENELKDIYQITGEVLFRNHKIWRKAIPQFNVGHDQLMSDIDSFEKCNPNISILGNWRTGVAIGDCIHF